ncbi:MAG TPA: PHB depolymerase family esterase [Hyphomicrobiales bacterium]|nr:PHB depolymerase family esterase [Hyphomicrobiales bacterium]
MTKCRPSFAKSVFAALMAIAGAAPAIAEDIARNLQAGGYERSYTMFLPDRLKGTRAPLPVVVVLHGGLGTGRIVRRQMHMDHVAEREGFAVVYPEGLGRGWNDGRSDRLRQRGVYGKADDVAFLRTLVETLVEEKIADRSRVYLTGPSNGGMMTLRMGCEAADLFAAIAPIIANMPADIAQSCKPSRPVPILLINATADPLVPWNGGGVGLAEERGQVVSTEETIGFWRRTNGCSENAKKADIAEERADDRTNAQLELYRECASGAPVALIRVVGGGHRIPGREDRPHPVIDWVFGPQNHSFETAEKVWSFFAGTAQR